MWLNPTLVIHSSDNTFPQVGLTLIIALVSICTPMQNGDRYIHKMRQKCCCMHTTYHKLDKVSPKNLQTVLKHVFRVFNRKGCINYPTSMGHELDLMHQAINPYFDTWHFMCQELKVLFKPLEFLGSYLKFCLSLFHLRRK
jgi:hypothetical protein